MLLDASFAGCTPIDSGMPSAKQDLGELLCRVKARACSNETVDTGSGRSYDFQCICPPPDTPQGLGRGYFFEGGDAL
jgi:hypothetical protein